jgi:Caspase domain
MLFALSKGLNVDIRDRFGKQVGMYQKSHALLIGVSDYKAGWPDLETIPSELTTVATMLESQGFNVKKVMDPTSRGLKDAFEAFIDQYGYNKNDRLLFFYSGHGYSRKNGRKGYLVPTDAPDPRKGTGHESGPFLGQADRNQTRPLSV